MSSERLLYFAKEDGPLQVQEKAVDKLIEETEKEISLIENNIKNQTDRLALLHRKVRLSQREKNRLVKRQAAERNGNNAS